VSWCESEEQLGEAVVPWLQSLGWDVYQEVQARAGGKVADVVALRGPVSWVIELKRSFTWALIEQAYDWRDQANRVSVCIPWKRRSAYRGRAAWECLQHLGIGVLIAEREQVCNYQVPPGDPSRWQRQVRIKERRPGHLVREPRLAVAWRELLTEQHATYAKAGTADGSYWTPFKAMVQAVKQYLERNPGSTIKETVEGIQYHHYASNASCGNQLLRGIDGGWIEGLRADRSTRPMLLYLEDGE